MGYKNYQTPPHEFLPWHQRYHFTIDACGGPDDPIRPFLSRYWSRQDNGLLQDWSGERVWCNPPYEGIDAWFEQRHRAEFVMYLLPPSVDTRWFHKYVWHNKDAVMDFLDHRIAFLINGVVDPNPRAGNLIVMYGDAYVNRSP